MVSIFKVFHLLFLNRMDGLQLQLFLRVIQSRIAAMNFFFILDYQKGEKNVSHLTV